MHKIIKLNNGPCVILNHMPHMESATIGVWIDTGSRNETKRISGISHFLEHLIFKGTPTRDTRKIKEEIEGRGGSLNGFTSEEVTCYLAKVSGKHIGIAIDVLCDMVMHSTLAKKDIETERTVIMEEIKMYHDLPNHYVHDLINELMWPDQPLGYSIAGDIKSINSISRQEIVSYKKTNYVQKNMAVVLCGNFDQADIDKKIKNIFKGSSEKKNLSFMKAGNTQTKPQIKPLYRDTKQTRMCMGLRTFERTHKDRYALSLLHIILGANMSSRLFENIREKRGLAYEIGTEIKRYKDTGAFIVNVGTEHKKAKETIRLILKELEIIKTNPVPAEELKRAKEFFKVQLLLSLEDTSNYMMWLGEHVVLGGKLPDKEEIIKKIDSASSDELQRVANDIFVNKNLDLAFIGPLKEKETKEIYKELALT